MRKRGGGRPKSTGSSINDWRIDNLPISVMVVAERACLLEYYGLTNMSWPCHWGFKLAMKYLLVRRCGSTNMWDQMGCCNLYSCRLDRLRECEGLPLICGSIMQNSSRRGYLQVHFCRKVSRESCLTARVSENVTRPGYRSRCLSKQLSRVIMFR